MELHFLDLNRDLLGALLVILVRGRVSLSSLLAGLHPQRAFDDSSRAVLVDTLRVDSGLRLDNLVDSRQVALGTVLKKKNNWSNNPPFWRQNGGSQIGSLPARS